MIETVRHLTRLLTEVIVPGLQAIQASQAEQIAANTRLERSIQELREHLEGQFAELSAQLTACRAELAAAQAVLLAAQAQKAALPADRAPLVH